METRLKANQLKPLADGRRPGKRKTRAGEDWLTASVELKRRAERLERAADAIFMPFGLNHLEFLVLCAADALCRRLRDAVSQREVAVEMGIGEMRMSRAMQALARRGFVDRGPSATKLAYRVVLTTLGRKTLRECRSRLVASRAALEILGSG